MTDSKRDPTPLSPSSRLHAIHGKPWIIYKYAGQYNIIGKFVRRDSGDPMGAPLSGEDIKKASEDLPYGISPQQWFATYPLTVPIERMNVVNY